MKNTLLLFPVLDKEHQPSSQNHHCGQAGFPGKRKKQPESVAAVLFSPFLRARPVRAILSGLGYARIRTPHQLADMKVARRALKRDKASSRLSPDVGSIQVKMVFLKWPSGALWLLYRLKKKR